MKGESLYILCSSPFPLTLTSAESHNKDRSTRCALRIVIFLNSRRHLQYQEGVVYAKGLFTYSFSGVILGV